MKYFAKIKEKHGSFYKWWNGVLRSTCLLGFWGNQTVPCYTCSCSRLCLMLGHYSYSHGWLCLYIIPVIQQAITLLCLWWTVLLVLLALIKFNLLNGAMPKARGEAKKRVVTKIIKMQPKVRKKGLKTTIFVFAVFNAVLLNMSFKVAQSYAEK